MIRIRQAGLTLIQDTGRHGYTDVGVAPAGAFDAQRHAQALALLNVDENAPVFEVLGDLFEFDTTERSVMFAVVGPAGVRVGYHDAGANHVSVVGRFSSASIHRRSGGRGPIYVAVLGLEVASVLGSASHDSLSKLGPAPVTVGTEYAVTREPNETLFGRFVLPTNASPMTTEVRVVQGPHIMNATWPIHATVSSTSRSGVRLTADKTLPASSETLASLPVIPGVIQLPPNGEPIILGPDSGVTGGYSVLGVVIQADLPLVARLTPNQRIILRSIDPDAARTITWALNVVPVE